MSGTVDLTDIDNVSAVVVDVGSSVTRAGFAGDDAPRYVSPTVTGRPKYKSVVHGLCDIDCFVGDSAQAKRNILALKYPMDRGVVTDWDDMEQIWNHTFHSELRILPQEHPVLMTEPPLNPKANREKMCEIMFETFLTPGFYVSLQPLLSLYSSGRGTGLLFDCGEGVCHTLPIYEGHAYRNAIRRVDVAGKDVTTHLQRLLHERGYGFLASDYETVRDMKEKLCYVAHDFKDEMYTAKCSSALEESFELPDGHVVTLGDERFRAMEMLFQPDLFEMDGCGIHTMIYDTIMQTGIDTRRDFFGNIILSGGTTMCPGFEERLQTEITNIKSRIPRKRDRLVKIVAPPERKFAVWIGGSILASLSTFSRQWITSAEYDEVGPSIAHTKCV